MDEIDSPYAALLLAYAGVHRLGWDVRISQVLSNDILLHAVSQGAIGIECRLGDENILKILESLTHFETLLRVTAERSFMRHLEGGCSVPLGVYTILSIDEISSLTLMGSVTSLDGSRHIQESLMITFDNLIDKSLKLDLAEKLGKDVSQILIDLGAREILESIRIQ